MCNFCNGKKELYIKETNKDWFYINNIFFEKIKITKNGNLLINIKKNHIDYARLDEDNEPGLLVEDVNFNKRLKINYCPMCGRKFNE